MKDCDKGKLMTKPIFVTSMPWVTKVCTGSFAGEVSLRKREEVGSNPSQCLVVLFGR